MGILHAAYGKYMLFYFAPADFAPGAGALSSPLVATQFAQLPRWSFHYLVSLGIACLNTVLLIAVFRLKTQDGKILGSACFFRDAIFIFVEECLSKIGLPPGETNTSEGNKFRQVLSLKTVHLLAFFILAYVGVEGTVGGWIVTYIIKVRGGGPSSGYISSGFFGALLWVNNKIGERRALFIYAFLAIGLQLIVWLVPSLIGGAIAVSLVGVLLGPMYPIAMNHSGRVLPGWLLTSSIGWIAGCGQAGAAALPFMTGAIASKYGIGALQPLLISMMALMTFVWALIPNGAENQ
ncbi:hypothetical protein ID866_355 [Astraeus odoratus]|nr:hypothetical protein ID866_355 [Astraeus odoratus]